MLPPVDDPNALVAADTADDCAVYRVNETHAIVQSVDFFTPIVDDPYLFGQIAVANGLSDVYAMGGSPITALSVISAMSKTALSTTPQSPRHTFG